MQQSNKISSIKARKSENLGQDGSMGSVSDNIPRNKIKGWKRRAREVGSKKAESDEIGQNSDSKRSFIHMEGVDDNRKRVCQSHVLIENQTVEAAGQPH